MAILALPQILNPSIMDFTILEEGIMDIIIMHLGFFPHVWSKEDFFFKS